MSEFIDSWIERGERIRSNTEPMPDGPEHRFARKDIVAHTIMAWSGFETPGYSYALEVARLSREVVDLIEKMRADPSQRRNFMPAPKVETKRRDADVIQFCKPEIPRD